MTKFEAVQNLKNVKLVIGNGFDLYCGLKTKYEDYFISRKDKFDCISKWLNDYHDARDYLDLQISNHADFWRDIQTTAEINAWDVLFCILSYGKETTNGWNWCDVESNIAVWLADKNPKHHMTFNWNVVFEIVAGLEHSELPDWMWSLAAFVLHENNGKRFASNGDFYNFLLKQLNKFETDFGLYICRLISPVHESMYGVRQTEFRYLAKAEKTFKKLCDTKNIASIDTFNYDNPTNDDLCNKIHHINGEWDAPIFGIDSNLFPAEDPRFIFTKTYRRMDLEMRSDESRETSKFDNLIVFGHSLNQADYNYFFSVFDKMKIVNLDNDSRIVFAYTIHDPDKKDKICSDVRKNVSSLFQEYSRCKGLGAQHNRLLDELTIQGKIILYEI